jgi:hypothetical protein
MVTHNANLVVNANADQIIVAQIGRYAADGLPPISYYGGGLEEEEVRKQVCDILEGGRRRRERHQSAICVASGR